MQKLKKEQKMKIAITLFVIIIAIFYYIYSQNQKEIFFEKSKQEKEIQEKTEETETKKIIVHVSGAVKNEGIVELEEGARVANAIEKAGGVRDDAYTKDINYALKLEDGMKIYVPTIEETKQEKEEVNINSESSNYIISSNNTKTNENSNGQKVNINNADESELDELPGVGPSTAQKIIQYRKENGEFKSIDELKNVSGIGEAKFQKIKDLICV